MVRIKKQDAIIAAAIISAIGAGIAAYLGSPLAALQYQDRPLVDVSFGSLDTTINEPKTTLQHDRVGGYTIDIVVRNRGSNDGVINLTIQGTNAKIWDSYTKTSAYTQSGNFQIFGGNKTIQYVRALVMPDNNTNSFGLQLSVQLPTTTTTEPFEKINLLNPTQLTYQKVNGTWQLAS